MWKDSGPTVIIRIKFFIYFFKYVTIIKSESCPRSNAIFFFLVAMKNY